MESKGGNKFPGHILPSTALSATVTVSLFRWTYCSVRTSNRRNEGAVARRERLGKWLTNRLYWAYSDLPNWDQMHDLASVRTCPCPLCAESCDGQVVRQRCLTQRSLLHSATELDLGTTPHLFMPLLVIIPSFFVSSAYFCNTFSVCC